MSFFLSLGWIFQCRVSTFLFKPEKSHSLWTANTDTFFITHAHGHENTCPRTHTHSEILTTILVTRTLTQTSGYRNRHAYLHTFMNSLLKLKYINAHIHKAWCLMLAVKSVSSHQIGR